MANSNEKSTSTVKKNNKKKNENIHAGHRKRLREKFLKSGFEVFEEHEIVELLLFYCIPMRDTNDIAHRMINEFGSLDHLLDAEVDDIATKCKVSSNTAILFNMIPKVMKVYSAAKWKEKPVLNSSDIAGEYALSLYTGAEKNEHFYMLCLDKQDRLIRPELLNEGAVDEVTIYPRNLIKTVLSYNTASIILVHNHPGRLLKPSRGDISATRLVMETLATINVKVRDHIIVAGEQYFSFSENKLLGCNFR